MQEANELDIKQEQELPELNTEDNSTLSYSLDELKSEVKQEDEEDIYIKIEPLITEEIHIKDECVDVQLQPMTKVTDMEMLIVDSLDGGPPSAGSGNIPTTIVSTPGNTSSAPTSSKKFLDVVRNGDVKTAKQLIGEGININFILNRWSPLHVALTLPSMDMLELLLSQPNINLNISNKQLAAPLLWSIENLYGYYDVKHPNPEDPEDFVLRLIRAGCDINVKDKDETTPLHLSISYHYITYELLKRGADVNAFCARYGTALHRAIKSNYLELVCMLLYYNADIHIKWEGQKPFFYAMHLHNFEIAAVLNNYYSSIDCDVNYIIDSAEECSRFLAFSNSELFKAVWPRFDSEIILSSKPTFLDLYLTYWQMYERSSNGIECLYLILNSDIAFDLIECYELNIGDSFLQRLLEEMCHLSVTSEDWIGLIYMVLTLGFEVKINDINCAVAFHGLNQDLEPLIYSTHSSITDGSRFVCPLHAFVIGMETDYSVKNILQLFYNAAREWNLCIKKWYCRLIRQTFLKTVAFFSFPADAKNHLMRFKYWWGHSIMDAEVLQEIPEFPSLRELSRNQVHKYLVQTFRFKQPYQLQDCVKKLLIPNKIKNIILFKEPIY